MRTRLKDVAARAGVSVKTVSNVVNGYEHVAADTRSRVEAALADLGYVPNLAARGLRNGRSGVIALALPELHAPYFAEIAHHVVRAAADRGWTVLVDETEGRLDREREVAAAVGVQRSAPGVSARLRLQGYRRALRSAGVPLDPELEVPANAWHRADGAAAVRALLSSRVRPDALFCFNDLLALGALRALHEAGLRVPADVAVVGFDDIEEARYSTPALTTVSPAKDRIAGTAVDLLVARLAGGPDRPPPRRVVAPYELTVRESSG